MGGMQAGPGGQAVSQLSGQVAAGPGGPAVSQLGGQIAAPGQGATSMLDGSAQGGAPGQPMKTDQSASGGPGQSMKGEQGASGAPGQSMKPDDGASGGPGQGPGGKETQAGAASGPGGAPKKGEPELKGGEKAKADGKEESGSSGGPGASGKPGAADGTAGGPGSSGGPGAKKADDEELVDPDADRPNFGSAADDEDDAEEDEDEEDTGASRAKGGGAKIGRRERSKPLDPAYVTVAVMGLAVASLAGMLWLGRGIMMEIWPVVAGFYKSMGAEEVLPGAGLRIAESSKRLQRIGSVETLVVRGFISNIADVPKAVPNLSLQLYNEKREVIQDSGAPAPKGLLDPGASVEFEVRMELPQLAAAKGGYGVVWAE